MEIDLSILLLFPLFSLTQHILTLSLTHIPIKLHGIYVDISLCLSFFLGTRGNSGVDELVVVSSYKSDLALSLQFNQSSSGQGARDSELIHQSGHSDHLHLGDLGIETSVSLFVEQDGVVGLILASGFRPLLLSASTTGHSGQSFLLLCLLLSLRGLNETQSKQ